MGPRKGLGGFEIPYCWDNVPYKNRGVDPLGATHWKGGWADTGNDRGGTGVTGVLDPVTITQTSRHRD